ncbi:MAG: hypothetical protein M9894_03375 [Planctomycetes bacterium]|nr:hypothetical protein [Planctomycetota bacterium]
MSPVTPPKVPPGERVRIVRRALLGLAIPLGVAGIVSAALFATAHPAAGMGVAIGGITGLLITATWVFGALFAFDRSGGALMGLTMGLWPIRIALLFVAAALGAVLGVEPISLVVTLFLTHVAGHVVEAMVLDALARSVRRGGPSG